MISLNQLQYFVTTVKCGSFTKASEVLYITPQAASKAISDLEKELRIELFAKEGRGITPTEKGLIIAEKANEIVENYEDFRSFVEDIARGRINEKIVKGRTSIAIPASPYEGLIMDQRHIERFNKTYPRITLTVKYSSSGGGLSALQEKVVDAAVVLGRSSIPDLQCINIGSVKQGVLVSKNHPLANQKVVSFEELSRYPIARPNDLRYIYPRLQKHFDTRGCEVSFVELDSFVSFYRSFLEKGFGILFVSKCKQLSKIYPESIFLNLNRNDTFTIPIYYVYRNGDKDDINDIVQRFFTIAIKGGVRCT